jgi:hypothetical protein
MAIVLWHIMDCDNGRGGRDAAAGVICLGIVCT